MCVIYLRFIDKGMEGKKEIAGTGTHLLSLLFLPC